MSERTLSVSRSRVGAALAAAFAVTVIGAGSAGAAQAPVGLGTATSFAVLAGTTVTNTGPSIISGDLGVSPGTAVTGFPPGLVNNGTMHAADAVAAQAQADVTTAYNDAAGRTITATVSADLGGQTLVPGVYTGGALALTGTLTLDAQGDANAVFVFQAASTLVTAGSSVVRLIGATNPCNVYWKVGSSATLGTNSTFVGTVVALTSVSATTGASVTGRLFARNAAVTLDSNTITRPACAAATSTSTTTAAGVTTTTSATTSTTASGATTTTLPAVTTTVSAATTTSVPGVATTPTTSGVVGTSATPSVSVPPAAGTIAPAVGATRSTTAAPGGGTAAVTPTGALVSGPSAATAVAAPPTVEEATLAYTGVNVLPVAITGALAVLLGALVLLWSSGREQGRRARCLR